MNKPILYVDLDNVVFNTVDAIRTMYDEDYRLYSEYEFISTDKIKNYNFKELTMLTKEKLNEYFCSGRFFDTVTSIEGAELSLAFMNQLNDIPIIFVSIGTPQNIKGKELWVNKYNRGFGTDVEFIGVEHIDKSQIDMSGGILIDDLPQNLKSSNADMKICFGDYGWNQDWSGIRAKNWADVRRIIYEEVKRCRQQ